MNWIVAGLITGVAAYVVDFVMWSKVFNKGMDQYVTPPPQGRRSRWAPCSPRRPCWRSRSA